MSSLFVLLLAACLLLSVSAHYPGDYGYGVGSGYGRRRYHGNYRRYGSGYRGGYYGRRRYGYGSGYRRPSYRSYRTYDNHHDGYY